MILARETRRIYFDLKFWSMGARVKLMGRIQKARTGAPQNSHDQLNRTSEPAADRRTTGANNTRGRLLVRTDR